MQSHVQTRTLADALGRIDEILADRAACLKESTERNALSRSFAVQPYPGFFDSWAFLAAEYDEIIAVISERAPDLVDRIQIPSSERDFTVVGQCSLDARFECNPNGASEVSHRLADGSRIAGARVIGSDNCVYSNGLLSIPTETSGSVYLFQPKEPSKVQAAELAAKQYAEMDAIPEALPLREKQKT